MAPKAPGKHYRKGMSLIEIFQMFPDDATAEIWFVDVRWSNGVHCPHCGSTNVQTGAKHKSMPYRCRDKACGKRFSAKSKTVMESSNLGYQVWAICHLLVDNKPQKRFEYETSPRLGCYAKNSMAFSSQDS